MLHYLCPHLPLTHKVCPHPNQTSNFNGHKLHISTSSHFSITSTPFWFSSSTTNSICSSSTFSYYCFYHQYKRERENHWLGLTSMQRLRSVGRKSGCRSIWSSMRSNMKVRRCGEHCPSSCIFWHHSHSSPTLPSPPSQCCTTLHIVVLG